MKKIFLAVWCLLLAACGPSAPTSNPVATNTPNLQTTPSPNHPTTEPPNSLSSQPTQSLITPSPNFTPTPAPTPTIVPTLPATSTPTATLKQLTTGGCCVQPFWSPDSKQVLFIDKPDAKSPVGIYAVDVDAPNTPKLWREQIAFYTNDLQYAETFADPYTLIERVSDGKRWKVQTGGRVVSLSPDRTRGVWSESPNTFPIENRVTNIMLVTLAADGKSSTRVLTTVLRGGAAGWLDDQQLLMTGRLSRTSNVVTLFVYSLADGSKQELVQSERLRGTSLSRGGAWLAYTIAFDKDAAQDGLWLVRTDGTSRKKMDFFGAFQWRDHQRLVYIPLQPGATSNILYEYDAETNSMRQLTDPQTASFKIANGDWAISPDGNKVVFVNADDQNLWLIDLP